MAKIFKFDAIGRDLYPGEREDARAFAQKYKSPPTQAVTHKRMDMVAGRALRAAGVIGVASGFKASATVTRSAKLQQVKAKVTAGSALAASAPRKRSTKD